MSLLSKLRAARDSYAVRLRDFIYIFTRTPGVLICFFEGEDVRYYGPRLHMLRHDIIWESINCDGKEVALKLYALISAHQVYSAARTAYFFDKDFDGVDSRPVANNVYVTPCYSIENFYVTETAAKRVLRSEFKLNEVPDEDGTFAKCFDVFRSRFNEFLDAVELLNAWILFHRLAEAQDSTIRPLNIAGLNPNQMFSITLQSVTSLYSLFDLEVAAGNARTVSGAELSAVAATFDANKRHLIFRGKFQAFFMRIFFNRLQMDANSDAPICFPTKRRISFSITERNFLSDLSQHADTPNCLRSFLAALN